MPAQDLSIITTAKEKMLKKIRASLLHKHPNQQPGLDLDSSVYVSSEDPIEVQFSKNLTASGADFIYCHNRFDFIDSFLNLKEERGWDHIHCWEPGLKGQLQECGIPFKDKLSGEDDIRIAITSCEALIARTGSIVLSSTLNSRTLTTFPQTHIAVAYTSQLCPEIKDAFTLLRNKYGEKMPSLISFATGPSRSLDLGMKVVIGSHGPKEVCLFLINDKLS